jgi:hypothetical protein
MLEVIREGKETIVNINYSSLELMQTCMRKAYYTLHEGWSGADSEALVFGSAIHKGIEVWYVQPRSQRNRVSSVCMDYQVSDLTNPEHGKTCARCMAVDAFRLEAAALACLGPENKRGVENGVDILNNYFDTYIDDPYEIVIGEDGNPLIECHAQAQIYRGFRLTINYHGTLDIVFRDTITGDMFVGDHKTTWQLGQEFYNRLKPNHQYTGYVWLANRQLGLTTGKFMINGIQVAKTKRALARQFTERNEEDFAELKNAVVYNVKNYLACIESGVFPQNSPNPCTMYGGCSFRSVCDLPASMRARGLELNFTNRNKAGE